MRQKYKKRDNNCITAVQLKLETQGFVYHKWGNEQRCRPGDWLVNNDGDYYTVAQESFRNTYEEVAPGQYVKNAAVWAEQTKNGGSVKTLEGNTSYVEGDYLVSNNEDGTDAYAVSKDKFESMYGLVD